MGVRAPDDRTARDLGLLAVERRRIHTGGLRDLGAGAAKRVSSSAPRRLRARAARTAPRSVPHWGPGPVRRGRRCPVQAPPEDGRERPPPRLEVLGGVAGGPRGGPPDRPVPDAARRGVVPGRNRSHRRRGSQCERLMAHPSIAAFHLAVGDSMVRKKTLSELDQAEIKLQSLFEKRDALNQEAQLLRQERDLVHEKKREIGAKLRALKDREKRDDLQAKAKALIEMKRKLRGSGTADVGTELRSLKRRVSQMEMRQQTASLTLSAENELLVELKGSMKRLKQLETLKSDQDKIAKEIKDIDSGITEFFQAAEKEHETAVALSEKARSVHEETVEIVHQIAALIHDGNEKHEAFLAARGKADEVHAKVVEMREKVLSIKGAKRSEAREARTLLRQQNRSVRDALLDEKKLEASADAALKALLEKGKVEIGR